MPGSNQRFNIFLLKEEIDDPVEAIAAKYLNGGLLDVHSARVGNTDGVFYLKRSFPKRPGWLDYLTTERIVSANDVGEPKNQSTSALLVFKVDDRLVALSYGYGRSLLDIEAYEDDFGLKVVLGSVEPSALMSIDSKTFEELTLQQRKQVSKASSVGAFNLDVERDIVRAVTGKTRNPLLGSTISGADSLLVSTHAKADDIVPLCSEAINVYERGELPEEFKWVDNIKRVKLPELIARLNASLVEKLNAREWDNIHLAAPEVLDPGIPRHFRFDRGGEPMDDPSISAYMQIGPRGGKLSLGQLKSHELEVIEEQEDKVLSSWKVYRCVVADLELDGGRYSLSGGQWYRVNPEYRTEVIDAVELLDATTFEFPTCGHDYTERQYNEQAAEATESLCLDGQTITVIGRSTIELCDLMAAEDGGLSFFHVKKRGSSSTLSHLFSQGVNSAEMLTADRAFRKKAIDLVTSKRPDWAEKLSIEGVDPTSTEICFAVVTRGHNGLPLTLPFFSLVSLKNAAARLRSRGFKVTVAEISQLEGP